MIDNKKTVCALYDAFTCRDEAKLRELLHPEVQWIQCAGFPGGADRLGVEQVIEPVFGRLHSEWTQWQLEIDECLDAGNQIVVLGRYRGVHGETSQSMEAVFAHVYDVTRGQITRFRQFTDTVPIAEAVRGNPSSAGA